MKQSTKKQAVTASDTNALPGQPVSDPVQSSTGLPELFTNGIKDMYWAENHLVKSLPKMVDAAEDSKLKTALSDHLELTKKHSDRLEKAFELLGIKVQAKKCDSMEGLVMSGEHIIENTLAGSEARDTGIIMSALKVENFEITSYNGLIQLAASLGKSDIADLLRKNLADEMEANEMLTMMSEKNAPSEVTVSAKSIS
jgi:ferritin-like metal-binding protein YciE